MAISEQLLGTIIGGIFALVGALIGGMLGLLGNKLASSKQKENEKRKILINYYSFLGKYFSLIEEADEGNLNNLRLVIDEYKEKMNENGDYKFYIRKEFLKNEEEKFLQKILGELEKDEENTKTKRQRKQSILDEFNLFLNMIEQKIKEV